jgi:hypothetical protein
MSNGEKESDRTLKTRNGKHVFLFVSVILFAAFAYQLYYHAVATSATVDEPFHILAGHRHLQCGDFGINPEHPPLAKLLAAVPLSFRDMVGPPSECGSKLTPKFDGFSYGSTFIVDNGVDGTVIPTRLAVALMGLLLAALVFLAAWEMFGRWEALTALAILAFEPSIIANGSVVTTDMAISATSFGAIYAAYRFGKVRTLSRFVVLGLALGLMLSAKHSAVVFIGILFVLMLADGAFFRDASVGRWRGIGRRSAAFAGAFLVALAILWSFYGFRYSAIPNTDAPSISVAEYIKENGRPESVGSFPARVTEGVSKTGIFPESYVLGMADVIAWGSRNTFIFGRNYPTGQWFYFPLAFTVKSSIALLLLLPLGFIFSFLGRDKRREAMFLLVPAIAFFVFASSSNFTTGIRHILPVYAPLIVLSAAGAVWLCRKFPPIRFVVALLLVFSATATVRTAPNYIAFANDLWGGYENTHRIFVDSSLETGQNMKLVSEYLNREGVQDCWIATFVHPEMIRSVQPCRPMPSGVRIMVSRNLIDPVPSVIEGTVVVSLRELPPAGGDEYVPITKSQPIAFLGGNTYIYHGRFEVPLAAAISRVQRSNHFLRVGDVEQALAEGRLAIELAPNDPRPRLALGLALSRAGSADEARAELEKAVSFAKEASRFRNAEVRALQELERLGRR